MQIFKLPQKALLKKNRNGTILQLFVFCRLLELPYWSINNSFQTNNHWKAVS